MITPKPQWNRHRRELTRDGDVVKRFRRTSPAQIAILDAFEALGWPESIADPLNGGTKKLHSALSKLNRHQGRVIVRFELNGMGRIIWTVVENASGQENSDESGGA